jgi:hypothetical protein
MEKMGKINRKVCFTGPFAGDLIGLGQTQAALKSFGRDAVLGDGSDSLLEIRTIPEATSTLIGISKELSQKQLNENAALILVSKVHDSWKVLGMRFDGFQGLLHRNLDMGYWSCLLTAL